MKESTHLNPPFALQMAQVEALDYENIENAVYRAEVARRGCGV